MGFLLFLLFVLVPLGELALLLYIGQNTHWALPLGIVVATGVLGAGMLRWNASMTARRIQRSLGGQVPRETAEPAEPPVDPLIDGGLMLFAAGLLLTPGVVTDVLGLSLLFPPTRLLWRNGIKRWFHGRVTWISSIGPGAMPGMGPGDISGQGDVIDGEVVDSE